MSTQTPQWADQKPWISNRTYDALKWVAQILLPALGALYFGLSQIWGFPNGEEVVGTITIVDVFLGALLGLSSQRYNKSEAKYDGNLVVDTADPERDIYSFEVTTPIEDLKNKKELTIKVQPTE